MSTNFFSEKIKVLHIWNTAAVPSILSKYLKNSSIQSIVIARQSFDKYGFNMVYPENTINYDVSAFEFYIRALYKALNYDIIHVHAVDKFLKYSKFIYSKKPTILTYHGTDIRNKWVIKKKNWNKADLVTVSTPDLLKGAPNDVLYIPNPVDTEHFKRYQPFFEGTGVYVKANIEKYEAKGIKWAIQKAKKLKVQLRYLDRIYSYKAFPRILEIFEYYFDRKIMYDTGEVIKALSSNALQFLALGGKVVYMDKIITKLPEQFKPESVVIKWRDIYRCLMER